MDNDILKLIKVITLLYLCGYKDDNTQPISTEVRLILNKVKIDPRFTPGVGSDENIIESLRDTAEWMLFSIDEKHTKQELVDRVRINCRDNPDYVSIIEKTISNEVNPSEVNSRVNSILRELRYITKKDNAKKAIQIANAKINFGTDYLDLDPFITEVIGELSEIKAGVDTEEIPGVTSITDFTDANQIKQVLEKGKVLTSPEGILNTGLQGLNDALGGHGIMRGWMYNCGAVSFGYKTGHLCDLTLNIPQFNTPWLWDITKKPLIIRCTVETTDVQDTKVLFQRAWYRETGQKIPLHKVDLERAAEYLKEFFSRRGYCFELIACDPNKFTVFGLMQLMDNYIAKGYEIHMCNFDYATKVAKHTPAPRDDMRLSLTYDILRSYCMPKGITVATAAQLDSMAKKLAMANPAGCTREFAEGSWYADSKSIYNELDAEVLSHVVKHIDGYSYWSCSRGKHRDHDDTPMNKRDFYYRFTPGGILPDVGGESKALYRLPNSSSMEGTINWEED
jgi:hypothetical protein